MLTLVQVSLLWENVSSWWNFDNSLMLYVQVALNPSGVFLPTGATDKPLRIYAYRTEECPTTMSGHAEIVTGLLFSADCRHLICVWRWMHFSLAPFEQYDECYMLSRLSGSAARSWSWTDLTVPYGRITLTLRAQKVAETTVFGRTTSFLLRKFPFDAAHAKRRCSSHFHGRHGHGTRVSNKIWIWPSKFCL